MINKEELKAGDVVIHAKGDRYLVHHIASAAWDSSQKLVVYQKVGDCAGPVWVRSLTEFCDGRFKYQR